MKKYEMLGVSNSGKACCILSCLIPFKNLPANGVGLEASDFKHDSTDWGGADTIDRTLDLRSWDLTGNKIKLVDPITFSGYDHDHGHKYSWEYTVFEIWEVKDRR